MRELTLQEYDVIFLQETFVVNDSLWKLDYVNEHYDSIGLPATLSEKARVAMAGRPEGGLAVLYKKDSKFTINDILMPENNIMVLQLPSLL